MGAVSIRVPPPKMRHLRITVGNRGLESPLLMEGRLSRGIPPPQLPSVLAVLFKHVMGRAARGVDGLKISTVNCGIFVREDPTCKRPFYRRGIKPYAITCPLPTRRVPFVKNYSLVNHWSYKFELLFNENVFTEEEVLNLLSIAGVSEGIGSRRAASGGLYGSFGILKATSFKPL
jgi:hypothetical protein